MRLLLDEDVPIQTLVVLQHVLRGHEVKHVHEMRWSGKRDLYLYQDAAGRFEIVVTNDHRQLQDPEETARIKKSGVHHVSYTQRVSGVKGLALAIGAIIASMPAVVEALEAANGQRLVEIHGLDPNRRYRIIDPRRDPPRYWPR